VPALQRRDADHAILKRRRDLAGKKNIVVINDEAHHCYRRRPDAEVETLTGAETILGFRAEVL
jgi:type III restriction enzyme